MDVSYFPFDRFESPFCRKITSFAHRYMRDVDGDDAARPCGLRSQPRSESPSPTPYLEKCFPGQISLGVEIAPY
jgi:hypothetical protein